MAEPPVTIAAYHFSAGNNQPVSRIVIHTTSPPKLPFPVASALGQARRTALYFSLPVSGGSAHYVVDRGSEEHCLRDNQIAHHAPPNRRSLGVEICGQAYYTRSQWLSGDVWPAVQRAKDRAWELAERHKVPWVKLSIADLRVGRAGICGHFDVAQAFGQSDHWDPGPQFPWDRFMALSSTPPVVTFPEDQLMRVPVQLPKTNGSGYWVLDGTQNPPNPGDDPLGYPRPAVKFSAWTGAKPTVNGQYHKPPSTPAPEVTVCESDNGFAEIGFAGFPAGSAPLLFLETAN